MKVRFYIAWYAGLIGYYWDRESILSIYLLPWFVLELNFSPWKLRKEHLKREYVLTLYDYLKQEYVSIEEGLTYFEWMDEAERLADFIYGSGQWEWNGGRGCQLCSIYTHAGEYIAISMYRKINR